MPSMSSYIDAIHGFQALKLLAAASLWGTVYGMQFLGWWYQRQHLLQPLVPLRPPAPPRTLGYPESSSAQKLVVLPLDKRMCPLCQRERRNPAMSCAGYAFCYTCLVPHVQRYGACPVSGLGMAMEEIRRVRDE